MRSTKAASWWQSLTQSPAPGAGVQPGIQGWPFLLVSTGSAWKALQPSANQPSICSPGTGGAVGLV